MKTTITDVTNMTHEQRLGLNGTSLQASTYALTKHMDQETFMHVLLQLSEIQGLMQNMIIMSIHGDLKNYNYLKENLESNIKIFVEDHLEHAIKQAKHNKSKTH